MQAQGGCGSRWLVCCGPKEYLDIAGKLVGCGCTGGIDWEPTCARALARLSQVPAPGVNVLASTGCSGSSSVDFACSAASSRGANVTVLVCPDALAAVGEATDRGVDVTVTLEGLEGVLYGLQAAWGARVSRSSERGEGAGDGVRDEAPPAPRDVTPADEDAGKRQGRGAAPAAGDAAPRGLRASGCVPRGHAAALGDLPFVEDEPVPFDDTPPRREGDVREREDNRPKSAGLRAEAKGRAARGESTTPRSAPPTTSPSVGAGGESPAVRAIRESGSGEVEVVGTRPCPVVNLPGTSGVPTICLASARGGVGKSALAVCMALTLARDGLRVALVDFDYQFGTCLGFLGADETDGLPDAPCSESPLVIDERVLARCRSQAEVNLAAYEFCRLPEQAEVLAPWTGRLLDAARLQADVAIVDLPAGIGEVQVQAFERADRCLLVGDQRALSLESLSGAAALCVRAGIPRTKLVSVLNRLDARHRDEGFVTRAGFELQTPQVMKVFDGGSEVTSMLSMGCAGELIAVRNKFALSAADLVHALCADLGCQAQAPADAFWSAPAQEGKARRRRAARKELVACP